ncbi:MAG: precorrin-3B C(17)-methyltransferase [Polyangiaceae bacterium]
MVGIGPGGRQDRTHRAERAIACADVILGYRPYLELIADLTAGKDLRPSGMRQEVARVDEALDEACAGRRVVLVSSGDAGIYGMAGVALERAHERNLTVPIETVAGVTASSAAAALLGAPLMLDFVTLSLSDLLVPWDTIVRRLELAAEADFVIALYNPRSRTRTTQFSEARAILLRHRSPSTPVGLARGMGHVDESHRLTTLGDLKEEEVDMRTIVIVGNSTTRSTSHRMFTPRGYFKREP